MIMRAVKGDELLKGEIGDALRIAT